MLKIGLLDSFSRICYFITKLIICKKDLKMLIFKREIAEQIFSRLKKRGLIVILGPRQSGKTTLSKEILFRIGASDAYFDCELADVRRHFVMGEPATLLNLIEDRKLVVFDEAQTIENIGKILKIFHDTYPDIKIIATGSSAFDLANKIREPLTGRADEFLLYPLSVNEVGSVFNLTREKLDDLMNYGLYPAVVAAGTIDEKEAEIKRIATNYLYKDVFTFEALRNPKAFEDLVVHLASRVSGTISTNDLAKEVGIAPPTVEKYIRLLEQAFVVRRVYSFSRNYSNELKKAYKVYFIDNGVRNALSGLGIGCPSPKDAGIRFESLVFTEFLKQDTLVAFPPRINFWRTRDKREIDFIRSNGEKIEAIEAKLSPENVSFSYFTKRYPMAETNVITPEFYLARCE